MTTTDIRLPGAASGGPVLLASFDLQDPSEVAPIRQQALHACGVERWLAAGPVTNQQIGRFGVTRTEHYQFACAAIPVTDANMRSMSHLLYQELLELINQGDYSQLVRFWNYVPGINRGVDDQEVYRQFCWGRADALANLHEQALPAATAIGSADGMLRVSLLSARTTVTVEHLENPRQVSAYHYPRQYGPRSPSFARATQISIGRDAMLLLSGTSSIVAHETLHADNLCQQTAETARNISALLGTSDRASELQPLAFRFYLREPAALKDAQSAYQHSFGDWPAAAYLQGDICRAALQMEIDGVFATRY